MPLRKKRYSKWGGTSNHKLLPWRMPLNRRQHVGLLYAQKNRKLRADGVKRSVDIQPYYFTPQSSDYLEIPSTSGHVIVRFATFNGTVGLSSQLNANNVVNSPEVARENYDALIWHTASTTQASNLLIPVGATFDGVVSYVYLNGVYYQIDFEGQLVETQKEPFMWIGQPFLWG